MNGQPRSEQLTLFPDEFVSWKALPRDQQQALEEVLSLLLERMLYQVPSGATEDRQHQLTENHHV